jgi:hypothetical protein
VDQRRHCGPRRQTRQASGLDGDHHPRLFHPGKPRSAGKACVARGVFRMIPGNSWCRSTKRRASRQWTQSAAAGSGNRHPQKTSTLFFGGAESKKAIDGFFHRQIGLSEYRAAPRRAAGHTVAACMIRCSVASLRDSSAVSLPSAKTMIRSESASSSGSSLEVRSTARPSRQSRSIRV